MGTLARLLRRKPAAVAAPLWEQLHWDAFPSSVSFRSLATSLSSAKSTGRKALDSQMAKPQLGLREGQQQGQQQRRTVAVFWDLDNKPPKRVSPFEAATRLKEMAGEFGEVVDVVAYANHHAFSHVPSWIHEERRQRKVLDVLESSGEVKPEQPYVCGVCGAKKKTHVQLTKHFKMLHEREQKKRVNRLDSLKAKKKQKERFWDNNSEKMAKYKAAARGIIVPGVGYGLMQDIRRAGVYVRTVKDEPQAADNALKDHMMRSIKRGVKCICLVSDDTDFKPELKLARERSLHTVVVGDLRILGAYADTYFSWAEVASGRAEQKAKLVNGQLLMAGIGNNVLGFEQDVGRDEGGPNRVWEFEPEDIPEEEEDSDDGDEEDSEERWRPIDRYVNVKYEEGFDSFSDSTSESDSEESDGESDAQIPPKVHGCLIISKFGINSKVPTGLRSFTTKREIVHSGQAVNESPSEAERGAKAAASNVQKPERLHYVFTMLESANKGQSLKTVTPATKRIGAAEDEGDSQHFKRVEDILRPCRSEQAGDQISKKDKEGVKDIDSEQFQRAEEILRPCRSEQAGDQISKNKEGVKEINSQQFQGVEDILRPTISEQGDDQLSKKDKKGVEEINSQHFQREDPFGSSVNEGGEREQEIQSSSGSDNGEEEGGTEQKRRPRVRRSVPGKDRVLKVTSSGPRPFYLSGFASESQADCDAVNKYYATFWKDERDVYRGRQDRKRKT